MPRKIHRPGVLTELIASNRWSNAHLHRHFNVPTTNVEYFRNQKLHFPRVLFPRTSPLQKKRIWMLFRQGKTFQEIARELGISHQNARRFALLALASEQKSPAKSLSYFQSIVLEESLRHALRQVERGSKKEKALRLKLRHTLSAQNRALFDVDSKTKKDILTGKKSNPKQPKKPH